MQHPLKRALLQRDLWTLFDWAADPDWSNLGEKDRFVDERRELQVRLGRVIPRLALSAKEIEQLPDNFNLGRTVIGRRFIRPIMASCGGCHGNAPGVASMKFRAGFAPE